MKNTNNSVDFHSVQGFIEHDIDVEYVDDSWLDDDELPFEDAELAEMTLNYLNAPSNTFNTYKQDELKLLVNITENWVRA